MKSVMNCPLPTINFFSKQPIFFNSKEVGSLVLFLFLSISSFSQKLFSTTDLLRTAQDEPVVNLKNRELDFLQNTNFELPLVDELEFRTETDEFVWRRQEYLLRMSFNGYQKHLKQDLFHHSLIASEESEKQFLLHQQLLRKYIQLVNYVFQKRELAHLEKEKLVLKDQIYVMRKLGASSTELDLDDLVDAENDLFDLESDELELNGDLSTLRKAFSVDLKTNAPIEIDTTNFIEISILQSTLPSIFTNNDKHPKIIQQQRNIDQVISEYALEEAENKQIIDFVQLKYTGARKSMNFGEEWSIGAGLRIPTKGTNRLKLNELELERIEEENQLQLYQIQLAERIQKAQNKLNILFDQHDLIQSQLKNSQASYVLEKLNTTTPKNTLVLLQIQEGVLKRQKRLLGIEYNIFRSYLDLLDLTGKVSEIPLRNYLSIGFESFD
ncbi:MAG: hypothetical protein P1U70_00580 [Saprospiraceae bacterium]|jgi:hypothetical protein|nr:hypothetical protein [Saprospiraceae bacterium]